MSPKRECRPRLPLSRCLPTGVCQVPTQSRPRPRCQDTVVDKTIVPALFGESDPKLSHTSIKQTISHVGDCSERHRLHTEEINGGREGTGCLKLGRPGGSLC